MPSPVGHALGALAAGWATAGRVERDVALRGAAIIAAVGIAPDLDLLIGRHSMETHSVGAAVIVAAIAAWQRWPVASTRVRIFVTIAVAWCTHPLLDALGTDGSAPYGVMMFWPLSREHVSLISVFDPISRRWWLPGFVTSSLLAALREVAILGPVALISWWLSARVFRGNANHRRLS
jgi:hypothetical protein